MSYLMQQNISEVINTWLPMRISIKTVTSFSSQNCLIYWPKLLDFPQAYQNESQPQRSMILLLCSNYMLRNDKLSPAPNKEKLLHAFNLNKLSKNFYWAAVNFVNWKSLIKRVEFKLLAILAEEVIRVTVDIQLKIDSLNWKGLLTFDVTTHNPHNHLRKWLHWLTTHNPPNLVRPYRNATAWHKHMLLECFIIQPSMQNHWNWLREWKYKPCLRWTIVYSVFAWKHDGRWW